MNTAFSAQSQVGTVCTACGFDGCLVRLCVFLFLLFLTINNSSGGRSRQSDVMSTDSPMSIVQADVTWVAISAVLFVTPMVKVRLCAPSFGVLGWAPSKPEPSHERGG